MIQFTLFGRQNISGWIIPSLLILGWPWMSFAALHTFAVTMNKAQIKSRHLWRCVIYSGDVIFWLLIVLCSIIVGVQGTIGAGGWTLFWSMRVFGLVTGWLVLTIGTLRLRVAYKYYLKFERPVATVLLAQAIVLLFYLNVSMLHVWL